MQPEISIFDTAVIFKFKFKLILKLKLKFTIKEKKEHIRQCMKAVT